MNQFNPPQEQNPGTTPPNYQNEPSQNVPPPDPSQGYQSPQPPQQTGYGMVTAPMSVKEWVVAFLICSIPIANIVMLFVWGFGSNGNLNRKNWAKAALIWTVIWTAICICIIGGYLIYIAALSCYAY